MSNVEDYSLEDGYQPEEVEPSAFVEKMEAARLARPCPSSIDMRGKVAGICKPYTFGDRSFFMDEASQSIFERRLSENDGVFTQGAYEEIINGSHTLKSIRQVREQAETEGGGDDHAKQTVDIIDFGFYRKRQQDRYELVTHLVVLTEENSYYGTTKDISNDGLLVLIPLNYSVKNNDKVFLSFYDGQGEFIEEEDLKDLPKIPYIIRRVSEKGDRLDLALQRIVDEEDDSDLEYLQEIIKERQDRLRTDTKSILSNRSTQVYERYYADSAISMPLYYHYDDGSAKLVAVGRCAGNQQLHELFKGNDEEYDYSILNDSSWLPQLLKRCIDSDMSTNCILTVFKMKGKTGSSLQIISSDQFSSRKLLSLLWAYLAKAECIKVFRLTINPAQKVPDDCMQEIIAPMQQHFPDEVGQVEKAVASIKVVGDLLDISNSMIHSSQQRGINDFDPSKLSLAVEQAFPAGLLDHVVKKSKQPAQVSFGYKRQRAEERYFIEIDLSLQHFDRTFKAVSIDLSTRGMRVRLSDDESHDLTRGEEITVRFDSLLKRASVNLKKVVYKVVKVFDGNEIALARTARDKEGFQIDEFFNSMISRNKEVLDVELGDVCDEALSAIYENLLVADLQSIPVFLARTDQGESKLSNIASTVFDHALLRYLKNSKKQLELEFIDNSKVMAHLQRTLKQSKQAQAEIIFLTYRSAVSGELITIADYELEGQDEGSEFIREMVRNKNYRVLQLTINDLPHYTDEDERAILAPIYSHSMSYAKRLRLKLSRLWAVGEINDITQEYLIAMRRPLIKE